MQYEKEVNIIEESDTFNDLSKFWMKKENSNIIAINEEHNKSCSMPIIKKSLIKINDLGVLENPKNMNNLNNEKQNGEINENNNNNCKNFNNLEKNFLENFPINNRLKQTQFKFSESNKNIDDFDYLVKIILVGESSVGKTNICKRYCYNEFDPKSESTTSFEVIEKIILVKNERIKACIWDTLGQEKYSSISNQYYRSTNGVLFIFDLTNRESFEKINNWIDNYYTYGEKLNIFKFLVGNKSDLKNIEVNREDIYLKTKAYNFDGYFETSALKGININEMFEKLIYCIVQFF